MALDRRHDLNQVSTNLLQAASRRQLGAADALRAWIGTHARDASGPAGEKLRRKRIVSHQTANVYVQNEHLPEHNQRFAAPTVAAARLP